MWYLRGRFYLTTGCCSFRNCTHTWQRFKASVRWDGGSESFCTPQNDSQRKFDTSRVFFKQCAFNFFVSKSSQRVSKCISAHVDIINNRGGCLRTARYIAVGLVSCDIRRTSLSVAKQWVVLYSEALSPRRHLDKVRAIVCLCYFYYSSVVQSLIMEKKEEQHWKLAQPDFFFLFSCTGVACYSQIMGRVKDLVFCSPTDTNNLFHIQYLLSHLWVAFLLSTDNRRA